MIGEGKNLVETLKEYVSVYDSFSEAKLKSYKLEKEPMPIEPKPPVRIAPKVKEKTLLYVDRGAYIKTIVLYILEIVFLGLLIYSIVAGSGDNLGFLNTIFLMGAPVVSIVMMVVIGIKIKKSNGIKEYKRAKFENRQRSAYNRQHAKEIKEALQEETKRYNDALAEYQEKKKEYDIAIIKYEEEVSKPLAELKEKIDRLEKEVNDFVEAFQIKLGIYFDNVVIYNDGKKRYFIVDSRLKSLFEYYIESGDLSEDADIDYLAYDVYRKITDNDIEDKKLSALLFDIMKEHSMARVLNKTTSDLLRNAIDEMTEQTAELRRKREAEYKEARARKEAKQAAKQAEEERRKAEEQKRIQAVRERQKASYRCGHCVHALSCPRRVKGDPNCAAFIPRK